MGKAKIRIGTVDFPWKLINACDENQLVVFAGAGVSMGMPSNLPGFRCLALEVGKGIAIDDGEPLDRYLGRVKKNRDIYNLIKQELTPTGSQPSLLHAALLKLFKSKDQVRLVTTNQDRHFTTKIQSTFNQTIEHFYAPALPLGGGFTGIVYLHGSIDRELTRMVFADDDFSRAYITEGWATRFLTRMFEKYTILFIGYGYEDTIMQYLARGLDPAKTSQRYALIDNGKNVKHWEHLGIQPVVYEKIANSDPHENLVDAINELGKMVQSDSLSWKKRVMDIVSDFPENGSQEDVDFIKYTLHKEEGAQYFARHADKPEWLGWADEQEILNNLFRPESIGTNIDGVLAQWLVRNFSCNYAGDVFKIVAKHQQKFNAILWYELTNQLAFGSKPEEIVLGKWINLLCNTALPHWNNYNLNSVLAKCQYPKNKTTALLLFDYLTKPQINIMPSSGRFLKENEKQLKINVEPKFAGERYFLQKTWKNIFKPHLDQYYQEIINLIECQISALNTQMRSWEYVTDEYDTLSSDRAAIEPHEQNKTEDVHNFLIDAARDSLDWVLKNKANEASAYIANWNKSHVMVLKRLAIYGISHSNQSADEKLQWIIDSGYIGKCGFKHEVFKLLEDQYSESSEPIRKKLLSFIQGKDEECDYLYWLSLKAPECKFAKKSYEKKCQNYQAQEYPDLYSWSTSISGLLYNQSPLTKEKLLSEEPCQRVDYFIKFKNDNRFYPTRAGLKETIAAATAENYKWGMKLAECLKGKSEWTTDTWDAILQGWQAGTWDEQQWTTILVFINGNNQLFLFKQAISNFLKEVVSREVNRIPFSCLSQAEVIAEEVWDYWENDQKQEVDNNSIDWVNKTLNHPGGKLAEFGVYALSYKRIMAGEHWSGFPAENRRYFEKILACNFYEAVLGCVMLARHLNFIYSYSPEWTEDKIIPLLDWQNDENKAQQVWHGYLSGGLADERLWPQLFDKYKQANAFIKNEDKLIQERFAYHVTVIISVKGTADSEIKAMFDEFIKESNEFMRERWAWYFFKTIPSEESKMEKIWNDWLSAYWDDRNKGIPVSLSEAEKEQMLRWTTKLKTVFPEVVERICGCDAPRMEYPGNFYEELLKMGTIEKHPEVLATMLCHLLKSAQQPFLVCDQVEKLTEALIQNNVSGDSLKCICNNLTRLGCPNVQKICS